MTRFRAPTADGGVLAEPGFDAIPALVEENRRRLDRPEAMVGGMPLRELRTLARREVLELCKLPGTGVPGLSLESPLLLAGHQPELPHPGVWVKNFAINGQARKLDGIALNLVVDNDTLKSTTLRFPVVDGREAKAHVESVAFDAFAGEVPYEDRTVLDAELFRTFPDRAAPLWENWGYEPLLPRCWASGGRQPPEVTTNATNIGEAFTAMRRAREREWGCDNRELSVSRLARTEAFGRFARQLLNDLPRLRQTYNAALRAYRDANGVRSANHPAPDLAEGEAPFWVRTGKDGRRERATPASDIRCLRPRALTLTLFARLCLGDFFIHGIGGGIYDEVTDAIIRDYFGIEPPAYQVLSATLLLPLPHFPATAEDVKQAARRVRDLQWNPHRHLAPGTAPELVARRAALAAKDPPREDHAARKAWFRELRDITERLRPLVAGEILAAEAGRARVRDEADANAVLTRRDYSWVLYPEEVLRPFLQRFL